MGKLINVPQGKGARLIKDILFSEIDGLYTEGFSSCVIIVTISKEKISLIHADLQTTPQSIIDEIKWVGESSDVVLIYREEYQEILLAQLFTRLISDLKRKITLQLMDKDSDGVSVSFANPPIKTFPLDITPDNLVRHPDEQIIEAVQKIEQLIGIRARIKTEKHTNKSLVLFDGQAWEPITEKEKEVNATHTITRTELNNFSSADEYVAITAKLIGIVEFFQTEVPHAESLKESVMPVAVYLEGYLNNFDALKIFKRNLKQLLDKKEPSSILQMIKPSSQEDLEIIEKVNTEISKKSATAESIHAIMIDYAATKNPTPFNRRFHDEYLTFHNHYLERTIYQILQEDRKTLSTRADRYAEEATKHFQQRNFEAAINLFSDALKLASQIYPKNSSALATCYWNSGRSIQRNNKHTEALFYLKYALLLRRDYLKSPKEEIQKTEQAIKECEASIKTLSLEAKTAPEKSS